jgi:hypothetical protein
MKAGGLRLLGQRGTMPAGHAAATEVQRWLAGDIHRAQSVRCGRQAVPILSLSRAPLGRR